VSGACGLAAACTALCGALVTGCASGPASALAERDLRNAEYRLEWTYPDWIRLEDGFFWKRLTPRSPLELRVAMTAHARGDLDDDGALDAVVLLAATPDRTDYYYYYLAAVRNVGGRPRNVATLPLGQHVEIRDVAIRGGRIVVEARSHAPGEPPEPMRTVERWIYRLAGDELVRVE